MNHASTQAAPLSRVQESGVLQNSLQAAILKSTQEAAKQAPTAPSATKLTSVVVRRDLLGAVVVFDVDSHKKTEDGEFINYWDGKSMKTAPIAYYKVSTRPMPAEEATKVVEQFAKANKLQQVHMRMRLEKNKIERDSEGKAAGVDVNEFLDRFQSAVNKLIAEMRVA